MKQVIHSYFALFHKLRHENNANLDMYTPISAHAKRLKKAQKKEKRLETAPFPP
jgi:hypothetical protein